MNLRNAFLLPLRIRLADIYREDWLRPLSVCATPIRMILTLLFYPPKAGISLLQPHRRKGSPCLQKNGNGASLWANPKGDRMVESRVLEALPPRLP